MATGAVTLAAPRSGLAGRLGDFVELTKPKIGLMVLLTVAVAALAGGWGTFQPWTLWHTLVGTALVAASAGALNQWLEAEADRLMARTAERPLASGRMSGLQALVFAAVTIVLGIAYLAWLVRPLTAALAGLTWISYVAVYTPLKRRTVHNTAIGAVGGAMPVLIGWSASGAPWDLGAAVLFLLLYLWQFPHFMAIAWLCRDDYRAAGMQMLSVVDPSGRRAGAQAVVAALTMLPISLLPATLLAAGADYCLWALVLGVGYVWFSGRFAARRDDASARLLLRYSLVYWPGLLAPLAVAAGGS